MFSPFPFGLPPIGKWNRGYRERGGEEKHRGDGEKEEECESRKETEEALFLGGRRGRKEKGKSTDRWAEEGKGGPRREGGERRRLLLPPPRRDSSTPAGEKGGGEAGWSPGY